jgi:RimJ/RimL family protein N-acetyltransferase
MVDDAELMGRIISESLDHLRPWMPWAVHEPVSLTDRRALLERWDREWRAGGDVPMVVMAGDAAAASAVAASAAAADGAAAAASAVADSAAAMAAGAVAVGSTGLHRRRGPGVLEIGYWIHAAHVRRGYATELSRALTDAAFTVPGIERVEIHHDRANVHSGAVPKRLGFVLEGEQAREPQAPGETGIEFVWAMSKAAWTVQRR